MKQYIMPFLSIIALAASALGTPAPVASWPAENNPWDSVGGTGGDLINGSYATGKVGKAFVFNGHNTYLSVPDNPTLDRPNVTNALTVCAWVNWNGAQRPDFSPILRKWVGTYSVPWATYDFFVLNDGSIGFSISDGSPTGQSAYCQSVGKIAANEWHFVAATYDGTALKVYLDGNLDKTQPATLHIGNREGALFIGSNSIYPDGDIFGGLLDEVAIYDQALTLQDIRFRGGMNVRPTANAGPDQIVYLGSNAQGAVTLNGSGSVDPEGDPLTYSWSCSSISADGVAPTVSLSAGIYMVTLTVSDGFNQPSSSTVHVAVVPGVDSASYTQMSNLVQSLTAQAQIDANTIDALTQKNTSLSGLLQSLRAAFGQIKAAAATVNTVSDDKTQAIDAALSGD